MDKVQHTVLLNHISALIVSFQLMLQNKANFVVFIFWESSGEQLIHV